MVEKTMPTGQTLNFTSSPRNLTFLQRVSRATVSFLPKRMRNSSSRMPTMLVPISVRHVLSVATRRA